MSIPFHHKSHRIPQTKNTGNKINNIEERPIILSSAAMTSSIFFFFFFLTTLMMMSSSKHTVVYATESHHQILQSKWMVANGSHGYNSEFELESESNRRILATTRYVSYGALQKNNVPCSRRGASYYNCRQGGQANPYTRGCSAITHCRS
ncbi:hypothetical protein L2E82_24545 [Cichorium intybus]|uniref:Uncharacterized protein n=1 Tax=Cichorium intybus TaxID=13427 RepID=A0ACB9E1B9_CICIN|nr:hypothetical protein L2E82_24545 [Cichorium intybus]